MTTTDAGGLHKVLVRLTGRLSARRSPVFWGRTYEYGGYALGGGEVEQTGRLLPWFTFLFASVLFTLHFGIFGKSLAGHCYLDQRARQGPLIGFPPPNVWPTRPLCSRCWWLC